MILKTKQPPTISIGDTVTISADGFCVRATGNSQNPSPIGIAIDNSDPNGYATINIGVTGTVGIEKINDWEIAWDGFSESLPPFFCPVHGEIGEEIVSIVDTDGKTRRYCKKCALEKLGGAEAFRWEDELTGRDFEEKE